MTVGVTAVVWYGGHQVLNHHLTIGQLTTFYLYVLALINPLRMTGMLVAQAHRKRRLLAPRPGARAGVRDDDGQRE